MTTMTDTAPRGGEMTDSPFLKQLAAVIRAEDSYGTWDEKSDAQILADFIVTREERREIPIIGDPDPDVMWRVEKFYDAIGLMIEKQTGCMASQMSKMSHEGFGRIVLIAGKLVVLEGDSVVFSRYDVLNGGTTLGALSTSVSTLLEIAGSVVQAGGE